MKQFDTKRRDEIAATATAGGSGGTFVYLSSSPNGIRDTSGNPTLLLVAAGHHPPCASPTRNHMHLPQVVCMLSIQWAKSCIS